MTDNFNGEQQDAINHDGSLILTAGAGSGKTRVLVGRYLKHLRDGVGISQLVAFTFTDKSAREMRRRIRDAVMADESLAGQRPFLEIAAIGTIHSYCAGLLKEFATAAKRDANLVTLDEAATDALRREVTVASLREMLLAPDDDLRELVVIFGWRRIVEAVTTLLSVSDRHAWQAFVAKSPERIAEEWTAVAREFVLRFVGNFVETTESYLALKQVRVQTAEGQGILQEVLAGMEALARGQDRVDLEHLLKLARVGHASTGKKLYGNHYETVRDGYSAIRNMLNHEVGEFNQPPESLVAAAVVSQRMTRVMLHVLTDYEVQKRAANAVDFDDQLTLTLDLLHSDEDVRGSVQARIRYLLIDELQDTNPVQMDLVRLLLGERLQTDGLFAVGDPKQSIYRFRGAELALFEQLRASLPPASRRELSVNYRSRPGILRFVNALSARWFPLEPLLKADCKESVAPVEFLWTAAEEADSESARMMEAETIAARVQELIQSRLPGDIALLFRSLSNVGIYENALRARGIDYYLVDGRAYFAQQEVYDIANLLQVLENPLDSLPLAGVLRSPICGLSDDTLVVLCQHEEGLWAGLLDNQNHVPAQEKDAALRARRNLTTWRAIKDRMPIARLLQRIFSDCSYDAALLLEPLGERKLANLWKLQELARESDAAGRGLSEFARDLMDRIARQPREGQAATVPENANHIVRIMTIHKAKGLEFPVVILPDLGARTNEGGKQAAEWHRLLGTIVTVPTDDDETVLGYPKWPFELGRAMEKAADDQEGLRLLYVACTRAEDLLILSSSVKRTDTIEPHGPWLTALADVMDLAAETPDVRVRIEPAK